MMESQIIRVNILKCIGALLLALVMVGLCAWMVYNPPKLVSYRHRSPEIVWVVGIIGLFFFGFGLIVIVRTFFGNRKLIIDEKGIYNNTNPYAVKFVPWEDVKSIQQTKVQSNVFFLIVVRNPKSYISKSKGLFRTRLLKINLRFYKTPIIVGCSFLKCKPDDLGKYLNGAFDDWRSKNAKKPQIL